MGSQTAPQSASLVKRGWFAVWTFPTKRQNKVLQLGWQFSLPPGVMSIRQTRSVPQEVLRGYFSDSYRTKGSKIFLEKKGIPLPICSVHSTNECAIMTGVGLAICLPPPSPHIPRPHETFRCGEVVKQGQPQEM